MPSFWWFWTKKDETEVSRHGFFRGLYEITGLGACRRNLMVHKYREIE